MDKALAFQDGYWVELLFSGFFKEPTEIYLIELTPYKGLCVVVCLLNGHQPKDPALENSYLIYYVIFFHYISPCFVENQSLLNKFISYTYNSFSYEWVIQN